MPVASRTLKSLLLIPRILKVVCTWFAIVFLQTLISVYGTDARILRAGSCWLIDCQKQWK